MDVRRLGRVAPPRKTDGETCNGWLLFDQFLPETCVSVADLGMRTGKGTKFRPRSREFAKQAMASAKRRRDGRGGRENVISTRSAIAG